MPVRLGPPFFAAAAGEPTISNAYRPTITSVTSDDRRSQVRSARLHNRAERTSAHAADKVFLYCRAAPAARGPSPLAVGLIESHGAGASGSPGRDARMPPGLEERAPGWPAVGRVPADPGRSGRETDASAGSSSRPGFRQTARRPGTSRWSRPARSRVTGVQEGAAARCVAPRPGITLSDERGQEERAHSRRSARLRGLGRLDPHPRITH